MRKNLCIVLILLICFTTTFTYIVKGTDEDENSNTTTSSTDLQTQKELLQKQLDEANANLSEIETDKSTLQKYKNWSIRSILRQPPNSWRSSGTIRNRAGISLCRKK